jgi:hypothetical protein
MRLFEHPDYKNNMEKIKKTLGQIYNCKRNDVKTSRMLLNVEIASLSTMASSIFQIEKKAECLRKGLDLIGNMAYLIVDLREGNDSNYQERFDALVKERHQLFSEIDGASHRTG